MIIQRLITIIILAVFLHGCSLLPEKTSTVVSKLNKNNYSIDARNHQLNTLNNWTIKGKIAFINQQNRDSANLYWHKVGNEQQLKLTTYLGIQVLKIKSKDNQHIIEINGQSYHGNDLESLIYQLTGYTLPVSMLENWLKGVTSSAYDNIEFAKVSQLPVSMNSLHQGHVWQILYQRYREFDGIPLATKLTIKQQDLILKIQINQWDF